MATRTNPSRACNPFYFLNYYSHYSSGIQGQCESSGRKKKKKKEESRQEPGEQSAVYTLLSLAEK